MPAQHAPHRQSEPSRQIVRLVEPPFEGAPRMERHRHDGVSVRQDVAADAEQKPRKWLGERAPPPIFEGMDQLAKRAFVEAGAASLLEIPRALAAARAQGTRLPRFQAVRRRISTP